MGLCLDTEYCRPDSKDFAPGTQTLYFHIVRNSHRTVQKEVMAGLEVVGLETVVVGLEVGLEKAAVGLEVVGLAADSVAVVV